MRKTVNDIKRMVVQYVTQRQVDKIQREMQEQLAMMMQGQEPGGEDGVVGEGVRRRGVSRLGGVEWSGDEEM